MEKRNCSYVVEAFGGMTLRRVDGVESSFVVEAFGAISANLLALITSAEVVSAIDCHRLNVNGDGTPVIVRPGLPVLSRHTSVSGREFVIMTTPSAEDTIAMLSDEL